MKMLAVLVILWVSPNGTSQMVTIEMPSIAGCETEVKELGVRLKPPGQGYMFCVERRR